MSKKSKKKKKRLLKRIFKILTWLSLALSVMNGIKDFFQ